MYRCDECETLFEEPVMVTRESTVPYGRCPNCGSDDYEQVVKCDICGNWTGEGGYRQISGTVFCDECFEDFRAVLGERLDNAIGPVITVTAAEYGISEDEVKEIIADIVEED